MGRLLIVLLALCVVGTTAIAYTGTRQLADTNTTDLTDAAATLTQIVNTKDVKDLVVDITTDKGTTVVITPILSATDDTQVGPVSTTLTIADGGGTDRARYSNISAERAKIVVTKTEAGSTTSFFVSVRGSQL